jgi:hypothetical protein
MHHFAQLFLSRLAFLYLNEVYCPAAGKSGESHSLESSTSDIDQQ